MVMPGRTFSAENAYRYGFNGKENDKDISEGGQDYGMRIYDNRLGRFLSVDPLQEKYPWNSPYSYAENDVISCVDLDGLEKVKHYELLSNGELKYLGETSMSVNFLGTDISLSGSSLTLHGYTMMGPGGFDMVQRAAEVIKSYGQNYPGSGYAQGPNKLNFELESTATSPTFDEALAFADEIQEKQEICATANMITLSYMSSMAPRGGGGLPKANTAIKNANKQTIRANNGNEQAAESNTAKRPTWQQSEAAAVDATYQKQVAFRNKKVVKPNTRGSVRPEGYKPSQSIEVKNYSLTTEKGIKSMISNVTKQVRQRQSNLPKNTTQNIVLDVRGQNLNAKQLMTIKSRLSTQTGPNTNVSFKIQ
jgi:RHS repeat-associated protein